MLVLLLKWIGSVSTQIWLLVVAAAGVLAMYAKGRSDKDKDIKSRNQKIEIEALKRLNNVKTNTTRGASIDRLRANGDLRD
jgi:hypothetical protein